jgi:hypothetical protein
MAKKAKSGKRDGKLVFSGALDTKGKVSGRGALTLTVSDMTRAGVSLRYGKSGNLVLRLDSATGLRIRKSSTLRFTGSLSRDLTKRTLSGKVGVHLKVPKEVDVSLAQSFKPDENVTSLKVTIRF